MSGNIKLYRYFQFARSLMFWQAIWFLYFQDILSAKEAILLAAIYDVGVIVLEVPSGYLSDAVGRRPTLILSAIVTSAGCFLIYTADGFTSVAIAQLLLGAGTAFSSGSDNAFLYDSLAAEQQESEVAEQELVSWRFQYSGFAISAAVGGIVAYWSMPLAFLLSGIASIIAMICMVLSVEPPISGKVRVEPPLRQLTNIILKAKDPVLLWLFIFVVTGYTLSHVPFVFAQPYLRETLAESAWSEQTTIIAGLVVSLMMVVSVLAGRIAPNVNRKLGNAGSFLIAQGIQIGLIVVMAFVLHPGIIPLLLLRMVPGALSQPYVLALTQPRLEGAYRASYLSVQSLTGRLGFSCALFFAAFGASDTGSLTSADLATILPYFAAVGIAIWLFLALMRAVLKSSSRTNI